MIIIVFQHHNLTYKIFLSCVIIYNNTLIPLNLMTVLSSLHMTIRKNASKILILIQCKESYQRSKYMKGVNRKIRIATTKTLILIILSTCYKNQLHIVMMIKHKNLIRDRRYQNDHIVIGLVKKIFN